MKTMNQLILFAAGLFLAVAAVLKFIEPFNYAIPSIRDGFELKKVLDYYEFYLLQIPLEFALGIWLLSGLFRKAAWIAATLCFFGFIFITSFKWAAGAESCGCFGPVHVEPWKTLFFIDIPIFLLLVIFRPSKEEKLLPPPWPNLWHMLGVAVPTIGLMVIAAPAMVAFRPEFKDIREETGTKVDVSKYLADQKKLQQKPEINQIEIVVPTEQVETMEPVEPEKTSDAVITDSVETKVEPEQTIEVEQSETPQWPWLEYIDIANQLRDGITLVLLYHHDCSTCAEFVPKYDEYYKQMQEVGDDSFKIAFIAAPPYGEDGPVPDDTVCLRGKISDERKWAITSPYVVALIDGGFARDWKQGTAPEAEKILEEIFSMEQ